MIAFNPGTAHYAGISPLEVISRYQTQIPVNLHGIASELGILVSYESASLGNNAGMIYRSNTPSGFSITINQNDNPRRQRFTLAHEIAHYILHADMIGDGLVDDPMYRSGMRSDFETQANRLAADIILPKQAVLNNYKMGLSLPDLARRFEVSEQAMAICLDQMNLGF
jgi:Zn-dependent peptidase ImmA (M78 family)